MFKFAKMGTSFVMNKICLLGTSHKCRFMLVLPFNQSALAMITSDMGESPIIKF